ncbi:MAG: response regulator transcription factor [Anaerolineae bacterium]|jgi:DNA-binding NarL/FixJ family response regulator|nr:response regulator transcription factor [Anaerolineae bacterium]
MESIKVLLADDHAIVRAGLRNALASLPELEIVGEAGNGRELMEALETLQPDFLVVDVNMPEFDPVAAMRRARIEHPAMKILAVSAYDDQAYVVGLLSVGVDGYHLKDQPLADLQFAVRKILAGDRWISGPLVNRLVTQPSFANSTPTTLLTRRQRELLRLLTLGYDNRRIAQELELSVKTVENHLTALYRTIDVGSRLEAYNYVIRHPEALATQGSEVVQVKDETWTAPHLTVLLLDDNARYRAQLCRLIGKVCPTASLYEAEDCAEALRLVGQVSPQLAFIDVVLPEEDGIQCARRIKALSPTTRLILISAYPDREFRRLGLIAGAVAFLDKKDLDAATVRQVVEDMLDSGVSY